MQLKQYDVVIVGGGIVGSLMALLLSQDQSINVQIALIDPNIEHSPKAIKDEWHNQSRRVSAINTALMALLRATLGDLIDHIAAPIASMQVFTPECGGHFTIHAARYQQKALASVIAADTLSELLLSKLKRASNITIIPSRVTTITNSGAGYQLAIDDFQINCDYLIAADGPKSHVRHQLLVPKVAVGHNVFAISAQAILPNMQQCDRAFQWFLNDGSILGVLPVVDATQQSQVYSLVWSQSVRQSTRGSIDETRGAKSQPVSAQELQKKLSNYASQISDPHLLNGIEIISIPKVWPLQRQFIQTKALARTNPGLFFIGDAAHVIHPLAGQGLNIGLQDAYDLLRFFQCLQQRKKTLYTLSTRYCAARFVRTQQQLYVGELLATFFAQKSWQAYKLGAFSFRFFDQHRLLKKAIVSHMSFSKALPLC